MRKNTRTLAIVFVSLWLAGTAAALSREGKAELKRAEQAAKQDDCQTAIANYQLVLAEHYRPGRTQLALGELYRQSGNEEEAEKYFSLALKETLAATEALSANLNLGQIGYRHKDYVKAMEYFRACVALKKNYGPAHLGLAVVYKDIQMFPEALKELEQVSKKDKLKYDYNLAKGEILKNWGVYEKAQVFLEKAIVLNPTSADAHWALADIYYRQKDFGKSLGELKYLAATGPTAQVYQRMALSLYYLGEYERAIASLLEAIKLEPNDYLNYTIGGLINSGHGDWDKAEGQFRQALEINPASTISLFGQAECAARRKDLAVARSNWQKITDEKKSPWISELAAWELDKLKGVK